MKTDAKSPLPMAYFQDSTLKNSQPNGMPCHLENISGGPLTFHQQPWVTAESPCVLLLSDTPEMSLLQVKSCCINI